MSTNTIQSENEGVTKQLSSWISRTQVSDIPQDVLERAKYLILDGIACAMVAAHLPWSETAAKAIFGMESPGKCTVFGWDHSKKLSPIAATTLNSAFIQGFELDDYHSRAPLHSNSLLIPALMAASEADEQSVVSGKDFLRAYVVGCEVGPRVGLALHGADLLSRGWHSGALQGPSATAAAVSSLLHLEPNQIEWALGTACTQAGGLMSAQFGSMAKRMQHGFASRNGLLATFLAKENYTGIEEVFETPYGGFLSCFSQGANYEVKSLPEELVSGLGSRWELHGIRVKLHGAMAALHGTIDCCEALQKEHPDLFAAENLQNIAKIETQHGRAAYEHGGWKAPTDKPMSSTAAQMSIQYAASAQLLDREVLMSQYGASKLNRPEVRELMTKVEPTLKEEFDETKGMSFKTIVKVYFKSSADPVQAEVQAPKGISPPVSNEDIVEKFRNLVKGVISEERRDAIEKTVTGLESLADMKELAELLGGESTCPIDV